MCDAARYSLGLTEESTPAWMLNETPLPRGILRVDLPEDQAAVHFCMIIALTSSSFRHADFDQPTSAAWETTWIKLLGDAHCIAGGLAEAYGFDPICGTALVLGYLIIPQTDVIQAAKSHDSVGFFHSFPTLRNRVQRDAFRAKREVDEMIRRHSAKVGPKLYFAGLMEGLGWHGSRDWESRFHVYMDVLREREGCEYHLPRPTDHRHLRLIWERTGTYLKKHLPDEPQYWVSWQD
jgi:hypothetical protein